MKPLLLVDVDGVLLLQHSRPDLVACSHGWIDPMNAMRLAVLSATFEPVWCTGWAEHANIHIAPLFNLPAWPVIDLRMPRDWVPRPEYVPGSHDHTRKQQMNWKLASVFDWLEQHGDRPVAWLDDQIGQTDVKRWAQTRPHTKLVHVREDLGLTHHDMMNLRAFLDEIA